MAWIYLMERSMDEWQHNCTREGRVLLIPANECCDRCGMEAPGDHYFDRLERWIGFGADNAPVSDGVIAPVLPTTAERLRDAAKFLRDEVAGNQPRRAMQYVADELDAIADGVTAVPAPTDDAEAHHRAVASWKKAAANMVAHWKANGPTVEAQWCTHAAQLLSMAPELLNHPSVAPVEAQSSDWQPIETVPKDGREVILREGARVGAACWITWPEQRGPNGEVSEDSGEGWTVGYDGNLWRAPDAWQAMPPAGVTTCAPQPRFTDADCTEPNRAACPRLCIDFCNKAETARERPSGVASIARSLAVSVGIGHGLTREQAEELATDVLRAPGVTATHNCQSCNGTGSGGMGVGCTDCLGTGRVPDVYGAKTCDCATRLGGRVDGDVHFEECPNFVPTTSGVDSVDGSRR